MEERFFPLIPGFAEWVNKIVSAYEDRDATNEELADLIRICPTRIRISGYSLTPIIIEVPGEQRGTVKNEAQGPSIEITLQIN
jgi:hypothetical protein